ncbi:MAG: GcrA family cell cycle regulator [Alphaproteobacteria bacterium]|nr:GcrA family cell cycle regulator [Alphaproteobacteria bacterium]
MNWTNERVEQLRLLWTEGWSASQIAREMGGTTRNAVIGKVHRLGLSGRSRTVQKNTPKPKKTTLTYLATRKPAYASPVVPDGAIKFASSSTNNSNKLVRKKDTVLTDATPKQCKTILELTEYTCKWPIGDPNTENFHFCGQKTSTGLPYCEHHASVAYQPLYEKRREHRSNACE